MKTLLLLRHGKTEAESKQGDKARVLTERGAADAAVMGWRVGATVGRPDRIVSSRARRARQTAAIAAAAMDFRGRVRYKRGFYYVSAEALLRRVQRFPDKADSVLLVGHNPGLEELAALLAAPDGTPGHLPPAGLAHLEFAVDRWRDVAPGSGRLRMEVPSAE